MLRRLRVTVEGHAYDVTVEDLTTTDNVLYPGPSSMPPTAQAGPVPPTTPVADSPPPAAPQPAAAGGSDAAEGAVVSTMSGVVNEVLVKVGDEVQSGDTVAHIEAMKMKTPLVATRSGTVASIEIGVGEPVLAGQTVLTLS